MSTFDTIWEDKIYGQGQHLNRYPFDSVVTFVFRHFPREKTRSDIRILELGSGAGNNLWFAAREGFQVAGIDGSASAVDYARQRFTDDGLNGEFHVGNFTHLPFQDNIFDLIIDRGSIVCVGLDAGRKTVTEAHRVALPGAKFMFNPYSQAHSSYELSKEGPDGLRVDITGGTLTGVGQLCFYSRDNIDAALQDDWHIHTIEHIERRFLMDNTIHAEWLIIAEKKS